MPSSIANRLSAHHSGQAGQAQHPCSPHAPDNERPDAALAPCSAPGSSAAASGTPGADVAFAFPGLVLEATAFNRKQLLAADAPQVALAGRSNVGKSSLVNALANRKSLAKVSSTPGKTRSVNYYRVGNSQAFLVDLPGYGYARCGKAERDKWAALLRYYFTNTPGLRALVLLLDARLSPQKADRELIAYARGLSLPVTAVLTKADKCSKKELAATVKAWEAHIAKGSLLISSAHSRAGIPELGMRIMALLEARSGADSR